MYDDKEETAEKQNERIMQYKTAGDRHLTEDLRTAADTFGLVIRARSRRAEVKVSGPGDSVVAEMIKELLQEKVYEITRCFQARFMGQEGAPGSWGPVKYVFLGQPDVEPKKGIRSYRAVALTSVMRRGTRHASRYVWTEKNLRTESSCMWEESTGQGASTSR